MDAMDQIVGDVVYALNAEVLTWPKPGLVTAISTGSHTDMDAYSFMRSVAVLSPSFRDAADVAARHDADAAPAGLFPELRRIGIQAEQDMLSATGGANTHRGGIFFGLLLIAAAVLIRRSSGQLDPVTVCATASRIGESSIRADLRHLDRLPIATLTHGARAYRMFGITGARGEVLSGFASVRHTGLPAFRQERHRGADTRLALVHTLISLLAVVEDSTLLNRAADLRRHFHAQRLAGRALAAGSVFTPEGNQAIDAMDADLTARSISPGGAADLVAVTHYLHLWQTHAELHPGVVPSQPGTHRLPVPVHALPRHDLGQNRRARG